MTAIAREVRDARTANWFAVGMAALGEATQAAFWRHRRKQHMAAARRLRAGAFA